MGHPQTKYSREKWGLSFLQNIGLFSNLLCPENHGSNQSSVGSACTLCFLNLAGGLLVTCHGRKEKNPQHALTSRSLFFPGFLKFLFQRIFLMVFSGFTCWSSHYRSSAECPLLAPAEKRGKMGNPPHMGPCSRIDSHTQHVCFCLLFSVLRCLLHFVQNFQLSENGFWELTPFEYTWSLKLHYFRDPKWKQPNLSFNIRMD